MLRLRISLKMVSQLPGDVRCHGVGKLVPPSVIPGPGRIPDPLRSLRSADNLVRRGGERGAADVGWVSSRCFRVAGRRLLAHCTLHEWVIQGSQDLVIMEPVEAESRSTIGRALRSGRWEARTQPRSKDSAEHLLDRVETIPWAYFLKLFVKTAHKENFERVGSEVWGVFGESQRASLRIFRQEPVSLDLVSHHVAPFPCHVCSVDRELRSLYGGVARVSDGHLLSQRGAEPTFLSPGGSRGMAAPFSRPTPSPVRLRLLVAQNCYVQVPLFFCLRLSGTRLSRSQAKHWKRNPRLELTE